jgi:hypothetical protein
MAVLSSYAKCGYGRCESRIHAAPVVRTDEPISPSESTVRELGLMIEIGLRRGIRSKAVL